MSRYVELNTFTEDIVQKRTVKIDGAINDASVHAAQRGANLFALIYVWGDGQHFTKRRIPKLCREYCNYVTAALGNYVNDNRATWGNS